MARNRDFMLKRTRGTSNVIAGHAISAHPTGARLRHHEGKDTFEPPPKISAQLADIIRNRCRPISLGNIYGQFVVPHILEAFGLRNDPHSSILLSQGGPDFRFVGMRCRGVCNGSSCQEMYKGLACSPSSHSTHSSEHFQYTASLHLSYLSYQSRQLPFNAFLIRLS